ncbi:polyamine transporter 3 [Ophiocordyceps sinensis CO18]|uniref:Polyamine transporter 3 n=1 Tax=Ophiocordyceps sinensis (strain Co18 / CGMCC 3.14243) TaxID=911162 RepID=T5ABA0_OPHSC|nr:polyamine transporter 3 [Ophiocordyceps sinensis CO18]
MAEEKEGNEGKNKAHQDTLDWDGPEDPDNPRNWSLARKWRALGGISAFVLMSPLSSTIVAPALGQIADALDITQPAQQTMVVSIFVLGFAFGPLVASPLSEIYGRTVIVQTWNLVYLAFNTACGGARSKESLLVLRFLAGLFGSATLGISGGTLGDLFNAKDRGKAVALYSIAVLLGPVLGPILGGVVSQPLGWAWTFYLASILDAVIQLLSFFLLEETYAPVLLRRRERKRNEAAGKQYEPEGNPWRHFRTSLSGNLGRAVRLLTTQPLVQVLALYNAFLYGIIFILYTTFSELWMQRYGQSATIAGLHYISMGIGAAFAAEVCTHINDRIYAALCDRAHGNGRPEFRIPLMLPLTVVLGAGLFWYGWGAQQHLHWIMPDIGSALCMAGAATCAICVNIYIVDAYGQYAASALAAVAVPRSLASFAFPLFAPYAYQRLGYGWTGSVLGFCALGIGIPAAVLLWVFGEKLRRRSPYAAMAQVTPSPLAYPTPPSPRPPGAGIGHKEVLEQRV